MSKHAGRTVAIVAHGGTIRAILFELFKMPSHLFWTFQISPASMTVIVSTGNFAQIERLNVS